MPIPTYEEVMLPLLQITADGDEHRLRNLADLVSDCFQLTEEERTRKIPSGARTTILTRTGWAKTYLLKAGLLMSPRRGYVRITDAGRGALAQSPPSIDDEFLKQYAAFREFISRSKPAKVMKDDDSGAEPQGDLTPDEAIEAAYADLRGSLAYELLEQVKQVDPYFFEQLVLDVLSAMGYGGSFKDAAVKTKASADEGIDGVINEDKLGLDTVCVQAKRWTDTPVGRREVQAFAGSMAAFRTRKGVFITTSTFTSEAVGYVDKIEQRIILIDGRRLAELMIDFNVGVSTSRTYAVKKIDSDYFAESDE